MCFKIFLSNLPLQFKTKGNFIKSSQDYSLCEYILIFQKISLQKWMVNIFQSNSWTILKIQNVQIITINFKYQYQAVINLNLIFKIRVYKSLTVTCLKSSNLSNFCISKSEDNTLKIWRIVQDGLYYDQTLEGHQDSMICFCLNKTENIFTSGSMDTNIIEWYQNGQNKCQKGQTIVDCPKITLCMITGCIDHSISRWSLINEKWRCCRIDKAHNKSVNAISFINSSRFISGSWDSTIKIQDRQNTNQNYGQIATILTFSPVSNLKLIISYLLFHMYCSSQGKLLDIFKQTVSIKIFQETMANIQKESKFSEAQEFTQQRIDLKLESTMKIICENLQESFKQIYDLIEFSDKKYMSIINNKKNPAELSNFHLEILVQMLEGKNKCNQWNAEKNFNLIKLQKLKNALGSEIKAFNEKIFFQMKEILSEEFQLNLYIKAEKEAQIKADQEAKERYIRGKFNIQKNNFLFYQKPNYIIELLIIFKQMSKYQFLEGELQISFLKKGQTFGD
ncbi:unnamed protein product [Paramecium sonneborni]|uniref:Uncharacterized protein n=1 Tax=Paramecium sonneborni TaxID=65129 RepID=A0A8S1RSG6_9CILI|nr:unnamed protein product [Paramecium sonneborni]